MSAETTGIPLVVRYNSRGQPDGLKEELNISVNSVSAITYKNLPVSALSGLSDVVIDPNNIPDTHVLTWYQPDPNLPGSWRPIAPGATGPGVNKFKDLTDVRVYPSTIDKNILYLEPDPTDPQIPVKINYSTLSFDDIKGLYDLFYPSVTPSPDRIITVGGTSKPFSFIQLTDTPPTYGGNSSSFVAVNTNGTGLIFSNIKESTITGIEGEIVNLQTDVGTLQGNYTSLDLTGIKIAGKTLTGTPTTTNSIIKFTGTNFEFATDNTGSVGSTTFISLTDTPGTTWDSNDADKLLVVNSNGDGVSFPGTTIQDVTAAVSFSTDHTNTTTTPNPHSQYVQPSDGIIAFNTQVDSSVTAGGNNILISDVSNKIARSTYDTTDLLNSKSLYDDIENNITDGHVIFKAAGASVVSGQEYKLVRLQDILLASPKQLNVLAYNETDSTWRNYGIDGLIGNTNGIQNENGLVLHSSGISTAGLNSGDLLAVGPSGTVVSQSSLLPSINPAPLEDDIGKLIIINEAADDLVEASALKWDYTSQGLQVIGDVSAQNYYGNITGATGEISNISGVSSIQFDINMPPEYSAVEGEVYYDSDAKTLSIQTSQYTTLQVGQEQVIHVRNNTGVDITNGTVVYLSGVQGTGAAKLLIGKADASTSEEIQDIIGIATQNIADQSDGFITTFGIVRGIDTAAFPVGTILYLSTSAGLYTSAAPPAPNHSVRLGIVLRQSQTEGSIFVHIDPGYDIQDLHDVSVTAVQTGDFLRWNGTIWSTSGTSSIDHGLLSGRTDDDHTQYVFKSNSTQARNLIQPTADVPALTLQAGLSNTGRLFDIKDSTTATVAYITIDGTIVTDGGLNVGGTKSFVIDHPTKEGMKLQYSCLEGPENGVYVRGRASSQVIELPDYWVGLVDEGSITVNLTPVGSAQSDLFVANIADNKVYLARESDLPIDCFYTVNATRKDLDNLVVEFPA